MMSLNLTIKDILQKPSFKNAKLIAGESGLDRVVKWVHIMEVTDIGKLLNGSELILSTGLGWQQNNDDSLSFLSQLIESQVSGLCIELFKYTHDISDKMIELANFHGFPIITFENEVRFIDITQDINTSLMNIQYKILSDLELFSKKLNQLLIKPDAFKGVLRLLHNYLDVTVLYLPVNNEDIQFLSDRHEINQDELMEKLKIDHAQGGYIHVDQGISPDERYARQSIQALGHIFSELIIYSEKKLLGEYELLVLDRCAIAISQDLVRKFYVEEQRKLQEHQWVQEWLNGRHSEEDIHFKVGSLSSKLKPKGCVACVGQFDQQLDESSLSYYVAVSRDIISQNGFYLFASYESNRIIFCLLDLRGKHDWKQRLKRAIQHIIHTELFKVEMEEHLQFGVGNYFEDLSKIPASYRRAIEAIQIFKQAQIKDELFYEHLHAFRLVSMLKKQGEINQYIQDYLGSLIQYDRVHKGDLVDTLQVYLEVNGSKKAAASKLFIVRQTLYYRLTKIEELLGNDYMTRSKRLALEIALLCYQYVKSDEKND